jgi:hypothetical protein
MATFKYLDSNPSELIKYMNKHVRVHIKSKNSIIQGRLHTIDPISMRLLLIILSIFLRINLFITS